MKLSTEFYDQLNAIKNFNQLDYNDPQVVAIRLRADHELTAMDQKGEYTSLKKSPRQKRPNSIYDLYENGKVIATGTANEIAEQTGIKKNTIVKFGTPKYVQGIDKKVNKYAEKVGKK
ncbi:DUF658 family protein [Carnobacterium viridans]|uniref:Uncharacterized protein n=1 Tax=Carnobacterium viridans TaxID=174587 RepID=A0A1H1BQL6_9LACT|nr:DUF658 family protein [Carnobacterium viridans]UDE95689.1 DUF658 family protein [Carnobacterium viridans]SDQ54231.1 Protein of unknown function [Carnobacterium viridans]